jgi:hypothetical protein
MMMMMTISAEYIIDRIRQSKSMIETGEPYYSPQGYAVAAQTDCDEAIAEITAKGINETTVRVAVAVMRNAATMTRTDGEEAMVNAWATRIEAEAPA